MKKFFVAFILLVVYVPIVTEAQNRITKQTLRQVYTANQADYDAEFVNHVRSLDLSNGVRVYVECGHEGVTKVKVLTRKGEEFKRETFFNLEQLRISYPDLVATVTQIADEAYGQHIEKVAWRVILDQKRASLSRDVEEFVPWEELSYFILDEANAKKAGKNTDGYDQIIRALTDQNISNQAVYEFMVQFDLDPYQVARYLTENHFHALLHME